MVKFGPTDLPAVMALGKISFTLREGQPNELVLCRQPSCGLCHSQVHQTDQAGIRESLLPVLAYQQEAVCRPILDEAGEVRQNGY